MTTTTLFPDIQRGNRHFGSSETTDHFVFQNALPAFSLPHNNIKVTDDVMRDFEDTGNLSRCWENDFKNMMTWQVYAPYSADSTLIAENSSIRSNLNSRIQTYFPEYLNIYRKYEHNGTLVSFTDAFDTGIHSVHPEVRRFSEGVNDVKPVISLVRMADRIVRQANKHLTDPEIAFDDEDGSLNFDLKLNNGHTMFVELYPEGNSYVGVYDEAGEGDAKTVLFSSDATEKQIVELISEK